MPTRAVRCFCGEPGKGDPLAHPRITLVCRAAKLEPGTPERISAERRYLNRNPKAKLYVGLGDFSFFRLEVERASLNGGFGKAYLLTRERHHRRRSRRTKRLPNPSSARSTT